MISTNSWCWLHLPKTGGTSTAELFRQLNLPGVRVDPDHLDKKHESIPSRFEQEDHQNTFSTTIISTRRLSSWLISDWHHKTQKMGLELPFSPVRSGLFYSLRLGGTWVAADYWIHYFNAKSCTHVVRLEYLEEDSNRFVLPLLPKGTSCLRFPLKNINQYDRNTEKFFGQRDIKRIYENNPAWATWEEQVYGSYTAINPITRLKSKIKSIF